VQQTASREPNILCRLKLTGLWLRLVAIALVPLCGLLCWSGINAMQLVRQERRASTVVQSMDRLSRILVLRSTVDSERIPTSTKSSLVDYKVPAMMASILLGFDPVSETAIARKNVDALMASAELHFPDVQQALLETRRIADSEQPSKLVFAGFERVDRLLADLSERELGVLQESMFGFEGDRTVTRSSLALISAYESEQHFGRATVRLFELLQGTGENRAKRRELASNESEMDSTLRTVQFNAGPKVFSAIRALRTNQTVRNAKAKLRRKLLEPTTNIASALQESGSLFGERLRAGRAFHGILQVGAEEARSVAFAAERSANQKVRNSILLMSVVSLASIGLALEIARRISKPLKALARKAEQIGLGILREDPLPERGAHELVTVTRAINELENIIGTLEKQTTALALGEFETQRFSEAVPGRLGQSMEATMQRLSQSIQNRDELQTRLQHQADHDGLTKLPNRKAITEALEGALSRGARRGEAVSVLFIDLDGFKRANDAHGHRVGDAVLQECAERLRLHTRAGDFVGRLGGDEFVMICEGLTQPHEALELAERCIQALSAPIEVLQRLCLIGASVGVAMNVDLYTTASNMLRDADLAMYRAKSLGRGRAELFDEAARAEIDLRTNLENSIPRAIKENEFFLEYQPLFLIDEHGREHLRSVEALLRWNRPGYGLVPPADFVPQLDASPQILDIGKWVLSKAFLDLSRFRDTDGLRELSMAVNIAARHLMAPNLVADVLEAIAAAGVPADRVTIEVTETSFLDDMVVAREHIEQLRAHGVKIAIDDFGTGYTSINQLGILPVDVLKIDASFVRQLSDPKQHSIVAMMIGVGTTLGLEVVAEGVETHQEAALLTSLGCRIHQGYLYGRPLDRTSISSGYGVSMLT
jgi:diguanylate cyclase (GGDEF)-like protein